MFESEPGASLIDQLLRMVGAPLRLVGLRSIRILEQ